MALADNNTNQQEAIAAALKAQKLIADNNIEECELVDSKDKETIEEMMSDPYCGKRWREILAAIIAENFRCRNYISYFRKSGFRQGKMFQQVFVGYKSDANAALLVYNKLVEVGETCVREVCRESKAKYGTSQGVKNTFLLGFCYGVKQELEKQSQALMIVVPKAVNDYMDIELASSFDKSNSIGGFEIYEPAVDYTSEGKQAGRDAVRSNRLEDNTVQYQLA